MPEPSLDRMRAVAELLDHPELTYPSIHVTGTNGKTTTVRVAASLACAHGLSAGAFTSPHVSSVTERLSVCGEPISEEEFADVYGHLLPVLERVDGPVLRVTYFEALTALAYLWFADKPVDLGVFEVGMGGTWDATNLVRGDVAVLCPVGLDHVEQLGGTVEAVAGEKAGIIKEGSIAVIREQRTEAMAVIEARASHVGASLLTEGPDFGIEKRRPAIRGQVIAIRTPHRSYDDVFVPLFGEELARNAGASVVALEALFGRELEQDTVTAGLRAVTSPGRLEVVRRHPVVILDGAHNPDAATALVAALSDAFRWDRLHLVVGMFGDKDVEAVVRILSPLADRAYACRSSSPRAAPVERLTDALEAVGVAEIAAFDSVEAAVSAALGSADDGDLVLVTGSFYTVADARPVFVGAP